MHDMLVDLPAPPIKKGVRQQVTLMMEHILPSDSIFLPNTPWEPHMEWTRTCEEWTVKHVERKTHTCEERKLAFRSRERPYDAIVI